MLTSLNMNQLDEKIEYSINLIKKTEKLALLLNNDEGYYVAFSGGKDSQVILELVKMANVKYKAHYNVTTIDPADNVRFIKNHYPEVKFEIPKKSFIKMVEKKGLPTRLIRWCCAIFKESEGIGNVVVTGVRKEESVKRSKYKEFDKFSKKKIDGEVNFDNMEKLNFQCVSGKDRFMLHPILEWSEKDVWQFIKLRNLPINPCYKKDGRVGCVFCPFAPKRQIIRYCKYNPVQNKALLKSLQKYLDRKELNQPLKKAEEVFEWWLSKENVKSYIEKKKQISINF